MPTFSQPKKKNPASDKIATALKGTGSYCTSIKNEI